MPRRDEPDYRKLPHRPSDYGRPATGRTEGDSGPGSSALNPQPTGLNSLEHFRAPQRRIRVHPLELILLWVVSAHLIFLPWALGTMHVWSQTVSLILSAISFVLALLPRQYTSDHTGGAEFRLIPLPKLLRFPIFWIGLALLGLIVIQGFNPAWAYQTNGKGWWMIHIPHLTWLPAGVRVPFKMWGPWRMLMIYSSAFLTVCALWVGITRRRTLQRLFLVLAINGVVLSVFGLGQRILGLTKIFGFYVSPNDTFFSSFIYKNHAGAYLNLALAVICGVGAWYYLRGVRRLEKSNPSGVFAFLATCVAVSILVSYARGATFIMMAYVCIVMAAFIYNQFKLPKEARQPIIAIAMLIVFGFFLKTGLSALNSDLAWDRLRAAVSSEDASVHARVVANHASFDMLKDHYGMGVGSGGYRFLFPNYQQHYPEIFMEDGQRLFWEHAHNDILEIPIELGVPGLLLILAGFVYWGLALLRSYAWQNPLSASVILGCVFMIGMSWGEFVFQNPAILITWCALWPAATLWAQLEEQRARA